MKHEEKYEIETGKIAVGLDRNGIEIYYDGYLKWLRKQLTIPDVVVPKGTLVCDCGSTDLKDYNDGLSKTCNNCGTAIIAN